MGAQKAKLVTDSYGGYYGSFQGKIIALPAFQMCSSPFHGMFGPLGAGILSGRSYPRGWIESRQAANRTPEVDTSATGNPNVRPQPGRKGKGVPRVRHRLKYFCRRSPGRGASLSTALSAGFPRNSQRTPSQLRCSSQSISNRARPIGPRNPRWGLSSDRLEIFPSPPESHSGTPAQSKETCFSGVKIFSYRQSQFRAVLSSFLACLCVFVNAL